MRSPGDYSAAAHETKMRKAIFLFIAALGGSIVLASFAGAQGC